jgi:hypothetical protein
MPATIELKYFNSFWLKKMKNVVNAVPVPPIGAELNYPNLPYIYQGVEADDWYIEEARIRGGYNNTSVDLGVKAFLAEEDATQQTRISSLIYSGLFNSRTGVNNTNQFSVGKDITKSADPANGSIQKLYAEDTNLIIFQQDKVSRALIDKDAIYSAEGNSTVTSSEQVMGQIVAYAGEYGISDNPESFAVYGYRKYFTDRKRNAVLRLSKDGMTEISSYGMHDFFRDELSKLNSQVNSRALGGWDMYTNNYILSIQQSVDSFKTLTFDESVLGWTSRLSYKPKYMFSIGANFYSINDTTNLVTNTTNTLYRHYTNFNNINNSYGLFYGEVFDSTVQVVLNSNPSVIKNFKTINYEGSLGWTMHSMLASSDDTALAISAYTAPTTLQQFTDDLFSNEFKAKENKYFANLINSSPATAGEIIWGNSMSGLKGFFSTIEMKISKETLTLNPTTKYELFSVASDVSQSSY